MSAPRRARLEAAERAALSRVVSALRTTLTRELSRSLDGTYGIRVDQPEAEDVTRLRLGPDELEARTELLGVWDAVGRRAELLVREAAFTHANRLIAIRVAEAIGLLPESLARGRRSSGFRQTLEVAPLLGSDDDAGYWAYLQLCGDELAHDVPRLFDPRNPLLALRPPPSVVDELTGLLGADDLGVSSAHGSAWAAPDTLGWTYQFFNSDDEREQMRRQHPQPASSWELAVRNQFFTPDYVVDFLVENSLGRRLVESGVRELADELEYLVDPPQEPGAPLELDDVKVMDPACGSGHFLLGAYDVLERAWELRGVAPSASAARIVGSLWGIDIDARAAQVAAASIVFRARRDNPGIDLPIPNVICAHAVPGGPAARAELLASVDASRRDFLSTLLDQLTQAPELGSLLKVDALLSSETAVRMTFGGGPGAGGVQRGAGALSSLADAVVERGAVALDVVVDEILSAAQAAADRVTSTPVERVLAADGGDALRLVHALSQRYDSVLMNPPFGEPIPATKPYLRAAYPWLPTRDSNLLAAFVGRGLELCKRDGYLGAITSRAGMFLSTFERWREEVLLGNELIVLADLGHKVMHEALVEAAAYVVRPGRPRDQRPATFLRLLRELPEERPDALRNVCRSLREGTPDTRVFRVAPGRFHAIPGAPMAYWTGPEIRRLFTAHPLLEGHGAQVRVGLQTGDDFRFVRTRWEVAPGRIARTRDETFEGKRWVPFAKGGEYSLFWDDVHLVVDFERDGEEMRGFPGSVIRNAQYYFTCGVTWPRRTASGFSPRVLPQSCVFADKGPAAVTAADPFALLGWFASRLASAALTIQLGAADETSSGGASKSYEVGLVAKLPWPPRVQTDERLAAIVSQLASLRRRVDELDETCSEFLAPVMSFGEQTVASMTTDLWARHEAHVLESLRLSAELEERVYQDADAEGARGFVREEMGPHPSELPHTPLPAEADLEELFALPMGRLVSAAAERGGNLRVLTQKNFVADRRIEVLAHAFQVHPEVVVDARRRTGVVPSDHVHETALRVVSYLVGCAFGRWDVGVGRDSRSSRRSSADLFAPVAVRSPGMLTESIGQTAGDYPLAFSEPRVLVDEVGHAADIGVAVETALATLSDRPGDRLDEILRLLGADDLRAYLRKRFFRDHLSRYSKSRRKAPIYWPLTTASRAWTAWVYAPKLTREAIYTVAAHGGRRLSAAAADIRRMESAQLQASAPGTETYDGALARSLAGRLDAERRLAEELRGFCRVLDDVAASGWSPDLDDGILLCAAPFADVFPDWPKDLADARKHVRAGRFAWSSVHRHRGAL